MRAACSVPATHGRSMGSSRPRRESDSAEGQVRSMPLDTLRMAVGQIRALRNARRRITGPKWSPVPKRAIWTRIGVARPCPACAVAASRPDRRRLFRGPIGPSSERLRRSALALNAGLAWVAWTSAWAPAAACPEAEMAGHSQRQEPNTRPSGSYRRRAGGSAGSTPDELMSELDAPLSSHLAAIR
jgi:hypothetical protein